MKTKVSIVVPVYNGQKYLAPCLESLQNQSWENLEILVVDDGSTDESLSIIQKMADNDSRIVPIVKKNGGVSSARNEGIKAASGDYLMFVDGDDWLEPQTIEEMLSIISLTDADCCFCDRYYKNQQERMAFYCATQNEVIPAEQAVLDHLRMQFVASPCFSLLPLEKVKDCFFDTELHTLEDWEYNFRVLTRLKNIAVCHKAFYHYRTVQGSASKSNLNERKMTCFKIPEKVKQYSCKHGLPYKKQAESLDVHLLYYMLVCLANGDYIPKQAVQLKKIARKTVFPMLKEKKDLPLKKKLYVVMTAVSPRLFCWTYHIKYRGVRKL